MSDTPDAEEAESLRSEPGTGALVRPPSSGRKYADDAVGAIANAYYPREIASADAARGRAQSAYAIASAIAALLLGAGLLVNLADSPVVVRLLGSVALVAWVGSAFLYLQAVASPIDLGGATAHKGSYNFVNFVLHRIGNERAEIDRRLVLANRVSVVALLLTVIAFIAGLFWVSADEERVTMIVDDDGARLVDQLCGLESNTVDGVVAVEALSQDLVRIDVSAGDCGDRDVTLFLPKSSVVALRSAG